VRGEALREGNRYAGATQRPLEGPGEVPVRGEPERPPLGVPDPDPLDDRCLAALRLRLFGDRVLLGFCLLSVPS
jgi:hypothetical protein